MSLNHLAPTALERAFPATVASNWSHADSTVALIPAHNEARFIGSVVLRTLSYVNQVIVVDDGSTDATADIAAAAGAVVVRHRENRGKGAALSSGFRKARQLGAGLVVMIDGDGQHTPEELVLVMAPVQNNEADIVIGSRYLQEGSEVPLHRIWGHRFFNFVTNHFSGTCVTDSQSGFRAFSRRALEAMNFYSNDFSVESEMQFLTSQHGLRLIEVPITIHYHDRPKRSVLGHGLKVLRGLLRLAGQYRPLLFFGSLGLILLLSGVIWGLHVVNIFNRTGVLAVGYAMISLMLVIVGVLGLSTGITLHSIRGLLADTLALNERGRG